MQQYGVRDVEKLLRLSRSTVRALIGAGFVSPQRGPRNAWLFSFQDLVVLRTAQALLAANVPRRRIMASLRELRRRLPEAMPLSGLSISAVGDRVVVKEGANRWRADSGQYLLAFEGSHVDGSLTVVDGGEAQSGIDAEDWFERGVELEGRDNEAALKAYERAVAADPTFISATINLGRLLHELGRYAKAERVYRAAMKVNGSEPLLLYNLGVLLGDMNRKEEAADAYQAALRCDPHMADCHYNLALLFEELHRPYEAIRHMAHYRRLTGGRAK
jgi:tetratricopeptide (TPR) repeat protein